MADSFRFLYERAFVGTWVCHLDYVHLVTNARSSMSHSAGFLCCLLFVRIHSSREMFVHVSMYVIVFHVFFLLPHGHLHSALPNLPGHAILCLLRLVYSSLHQPSARLPLLGPGFRCFL